MKEYIFARPNEVTLKEAMHDANFRGELIRCKDCRYNADCVCVWHSGNDYTWIVVDDDYCSCAERKEE